MRPINKGERPRDYSDYRDARNELADRIGYYCSYCEMSLFNRPDIEHIHPRANGGEALEWENFLISCTYCNSNKGNSNLSREEYLWPDIHNTFMAFKYDNKMQVKEADNLYENCRKLAKNTIDLLKLDRQPGNGLLPSHKDTRWISRLQSWDMAKDSLKDWEEAKSEPMARAIARTAMASGHFSIWMEVFKDYKEIRRLVIEGFKGTSIECFDEDTNGINFWRDL